MDNPEEIAPYCNLIWRMLTFSARTEITFTIREGSPFLEDGKRFVEFFVDGRSMDRPKTVLIPAPLNKLNKLIARVFMPEWMTSKENYMRFEDYVGKIFMLGYIPERYVPIISLPKAIYKEFLKQNYLLLDSHFKRSKKALALYEFRVDNGATRLRLICDGSSVFDFIVHLEPRRDQVDLCDSST